MDIFSLFPKKWKDFMSNNLQKSDFYNIEQQFSQDTQDNITLYPEINNLFSAFELTPPTQLKVVVLGQDPYHGPNQAHGLSFSVPTWVKIPPSLRNIYKELSSSHWLTMSQNGNLTPWAEKGVLMLNAFLSVQAWLPASHSKIGWEDISDKIISQISDEKSNIIFVLWWAFAQSKAKLIDTTKHHIIQTSHPSPFSAYRWFLWSNCFGKINDILKKNGQEQINWQI